MSDTYLDIAAFRQMATRSFPAAFNTLPGYETIEFAITSLTDNYLHLVDRNGKETESPAKWSKGACKIHMRVGKYDDEDSQYHNSEVWAFFHNENKVGYYMSLPRDRCLRLFDGTANQRADMIHEVGFSAPFSEVVSAGNWEKSRGRLRALILYYFLAADHVQAVLRHCAIEDEFRFACQMISRATEDTVMHETESQPELQDEETTPGRSSAFSIARKRRAANEADEKHNKRARNADQEKSKVSSKSILLNPTLKTNTNLS